MTAIQSPNFLIFRKALTERSLLFGKRNNTAGKKGA
jgi:hypothetical protein